jgi:hypothetical protein
LSFVVHHVGTSFSIMTIRNKRQHLVAVTFGCPQLSTPD